MADIFVSYKRSDHAFVMPIVSFLESSGWSVWWDTRIDGGERWDEAIERELAAASCIVVVWTPASIQSRWVRTEANEGLERRILVPVLISITKQPVAFKLIQATDLTNWNGNFESSILESLKKAISRHVLPATRELPATSILNTVTESQNPNYLSRPTFSSVRDRAETDQQHLRGLYIYVSDDKVRSLSPDIEEYDINKRLHYLRKLLGGLYQDGMIDRNGPFVEDEAELRWGVVDFGVMDSESKFVIFYNKNKRLLLSGSIKHLVGAPPLQYNFPRAYFGHSGSTLPSIVQFIKSWSEPSTRWRLDPRKWFVAKSAGDSSEFIDRIGGYLVEQQLKYVARILGNYQGLTIGSPLFVLLPNHTFPGNTLTKQVNHIEVDPDEIRMREEARAHKAKQKQKQKRFLDLSTAGDFSSYGKALELTGWMGQLSRGRDEMYFRQPEFNFLPFLANDEVFNFAAQNGGVGPFRLMDLMKEAYRRKNDEILLLLLKKIFDIDRYLPAMDAAAFIENNLIEVALPVLKQYSAHPANEARRAIGRAIDAIELKSGHEALLQNTNIESYERAIKLWVEFSERWGQRTRPVDKALLSSRLASFLSDPQVVERAAADVDGSPFELAQLANAAKDHGLYGIAAVLAKAVRT